MLARDSDALPFSFFSESFNKTQEISRLFHDLELLQIEEMKHQMERLVLFLSETEKKDSTETENVASVELASSEDESPAELPVDIHTHQENIPSSPDEIPLPTGGNHYAEGIILPEYKNPRTETGLSTEKAQDVAAQSEPDSKPVLPSLNDMVKSPPTMLDLKHSISLNDRFLFQRELFHNDREEMNHMMTCLNAFQEYAQAENYLREHCDWNFDNPTVKDFLRVIKKGFE